jgi:PPOX class probable F420-dependent enzyme
LATESTTTAPNSTALPAQVRSFLTGVPRYATIATINPDGSPHQSIIWFLVRGDEIVINSRHGRRWPANLRRDPRVAFAVEDGEDAVTINAHAEPVDDPGQAQADIAEMARRYDSPDPEDRAARFRTEQRVSFVLTPIKVSIHGEPA